MHRVVHFEIHASQPDKLISFYEQLFGWSFEAWGPPGFYWIIRTAPETEPAAPGINGGLVPRRGDTAKDGQGVNAFVCTVEVDSAQGSLDRAVELGGTVAVPRMPIPTMGWLAYAKDPDGNIFGMMENDPSAK